MTAASTTARPGSGSGAVRRAVIGPLASFAILGVFWGAWAALVPEIKRQTGASDPELGAALLWMGGGAVPAMVVTGRLWRRFGRRLVSGALLFYAVVAILPALAPNPIALAVSMALVGAASGSLDVAMNAAVSDVEVTTGRRLMYIAHGLFSLAVLVLSITVGVLRGIGVAPVAVLGTIAVAFLGVAALSLAADRGRVADVRQRTDGNAPATGDAPSPARRIPVAFVILGVLCGVSFLMEDAMLSWSALHLETDLGASPALGGAGPGLFAAAMFVGRWSGQPIGRRFCDREILIGSGLLSAMGIVMVALAPAPPLALVGLVVSGAGISVAAPALFGRAGRLAGASSRGAAVSMLSTFGYAGFIIGPPFVGFVAGATDLRIAFLGVALLGIVLAVGVRLALPDERPARETGEPTHVDAAEPPVLRA